MDRFNNFSMLDNLTMTQRQREIVQNSSFDGILFLMPTTNPCEDPADYQKYISDWEDIPMPPVKASQCPQLDLPGVDTLPGYLSMTGAACFFYASLQHYSGSAVNGKLQEEPIGDPTPLPQVFGDGHANDQCEWTCGFSDPCIIDNMVYTNTSANFSSVPGGLTTLGNTTGPRRCLYGFSHEWIDVLHDLSSIIGSSTEDNICYYFDDYTGIACHNWWLNGIFNGGNASISSISAFMNRGFDSLSAQLRTLGTDWDGNPLNVSGTVYETDVCVKFRGEWLIYPLVMVAGTMLLLLFVVISSSGLLDFKKEAIWKSSVLPFPFYGLEDRHRKVDPGLASQGQLLDAARDVRVRFNAGDDGWRLHSGQSVASREGLQP